MERNKVIVFAGTTEGRMVTDHLGSHDIDVLACVATSFGRKFIEEGEHVKVSSERLGEEGMRRIMKEGCELVIDATHPYAAIISGKIVAACKDTGVEYIRLLRSESHIDEDIVTVPDVDSAVDYLKDTEGNILVTTGSKELKKFTAITDYKKRVFARVLSAPDSSRQCAEIGFEGRNLFCMQGPFSEELNYGLIKQTDAKYLVTKDSGEPGGFDDKINAAKRAGTKIVLVSRPNETEGYSYGEVVDILNKRFNITPSDKAASKRRIDIIGIGMGDSDTLTIGAKNAIDDADLLVGAERMISSVSSGQDRLKEFRPDKIMSFLDENPHYKRTAVLVSGDTGFHSASKKLIDNIDRNEFDVNVICGISSISYLCSKLETSWDDAFLMSAHGQDANIIDAVRKNSKVIVLLEGKDGAKKMCADLAEYGMDHTRVTIGQDLGQANEKIVSGRPSEIADTELGTLCIAMIENKDPAAECLLGIDDEDFIRGDAPMTKSEIRSLSVIKLKLKKDSVLYDVGAGTGSVAIEAAMQMPDGKVYAVEKEKPAIDLILQNKKKFKTSNLEIVEGRAPEALNDLPPPTHVFIGGSSGDLKEIMKRCLEKNPEVRFVMNAITLETVSEILNCIGDLNVKEKEIISVNVSRSKKAGRYHLMSAQNPVYICVCDGVQ